MDGCPLPARAVEFKSSLPWLTNHFVTANLNNEYTNRVRRRTDSPWRTHGGSFISKPHHEERNTKSVSAVESLRNNRATCFARRLQGRNRSRQKSGRLFTQRCFRKPAHRPLRICLRNSIGHACRAHTSIFRCRNRSAKLT